jgi:TonB-linked SusC/RagA family outer membrane protein
MAGAKVEGSSRFSPESRWGVFPTASVGWRISNEAFLKEVRFMNDLMLRASWGQTGNTPEDNYLYFRKYGAGSDISYMEMPGIQPSNIELTGLKWETIEQADIGLTFTGFQNRVYMVFDVYNKKTMNLYIKEAKIPQSSGYATINSNVGELLNTGWEFMIDIKVLEKERWKANLNLNASHNENIIISLPENYQYTYGNMLDNGNYKISNIPGQPLGGFFGYNYLGVYPTDDDAIVRDEFGNVVNDPITNVPLVTTMGGTRPTKFRGGDAWYDDINHDGIIDEHDLVYLGDLNPKLMGGISPRVQYRNWVLNLFFYYKIGQKVINQTRMELEKMTTHDNQSKATNWRWRRAGDITDIPRAFYPDEDNPTFNYLGSSRFVEKGDFIRLKSVSLKYSLGQKACSKLGIDALGVYITGYNTYTWTNYSGQDPDVPPPTKPDELPKDWSRTPPSIRFMFGIDVTF